MGKHLPTPTLTCQICGTTFKKSASKVRDSGGKYCSKICYIQGKTTQVTLPCERCGTPFIANYSRWKRGEAKFCSRSCSGRRATPEKHLARLLSKATLATSGCLVWHAQVNPAGYGIMNIDQVPRLAHRLAWEFLKEPIPDGMFVLHHCDNPPCINIDHLWLGTQQDNHADIMSKERYFHKLTEAQVQDIRKQYARGDITQAQLASIFQTAPSNISFIIQRDTWRKV